VAVKERLGQEISYWSHRADELERRELAGQTPKLNSRRAHDRAQELTERLQRRLLELEQERQLTSLPPVVVGGAIVVPQGFIDRLDGIVPDTSGGAAFRNAVDAVIAAERESGREPEDVRGTRLGYDVVSHVASGLRFVKVFIEQRQASVRLPRNSALACLNGGDAYWVALAEIETGDVRWARPRIEHDAPFGEGSVDARLEASGG